MPSLIEIVFLITTISCAIFCAIYFHFIANYGNKIKDMQNRIYEIKFENDKKHEELIGYITNIQSLIEDSPERRKVLDDLLVEMQELANPQKK